MTFIEFRRIFTKSLILFILVFAIPVFLISSVISGIDKPAALPRNDNGDFAKMHDIIYYTVDYVDDLETSFTNFSDNMTPFLSYGAVVAFHQQQLKTIFGEMNTAFKAFYALATEYIYDSDVYINLKTSEREKLKKGITAIAKYIEFNDGFDSNSLTLLGLESKMEGLSIAWMEKGGNNVLSLIQSARNVEITETQRAELKLAYDDIEGKLAVITDEKKRVEFAYVGYDYLNTKYRDYAGFDDAGAADRIKILSYMIENEYTWLDFSRSYSLTDNAGMFTGTTVFDFIFKNFVYVLILLILFSIAANAVCVFEDIKNNTILTPLIESRNRSRVIFAKLTASAIATLLFFAAFLAIFSVTAISAGAAVSPPLVITTFLGGVVKISPFVLLLLYILMFYVIASLAGTIAALFSLSAKSFKSIITRSLFVTVLFLGLGGGLMAVLGFLNLSSSIDLLVALPVAAFILAVVLMTVIQKFNKKDF